MASAIKKTNDALSKAHSFFNKKLFGNQLPDAAIVLSRKKGSEGYYRHNRFGQGGDLNIDEIGINPDFLADLGDMGISSILVQCMISQWQQYQGEHKGRDNYYNNEWSKKAQALGFTCVGKATGQKVEYIPVPTGPFMAAFEELSPDELDNISSAIEPPKPIKAAKKKFKHTCPECNQNAWAAKTAVLICGLCHTKRDTINYMECSANTTQTGDSLTAEEMDME